MASSVAPGRSLLSILTSVALLAGSGSATPRVDVSTLPDYLQSLQPQFFPDFQDLSLQIYNNPEIGRNETFAHKITMDYFQKTNPGLFDVYPTILKSLPTAWKLEFSHTPAGWPANTALPTIGFMSEYDALEGVGHACGHNLIHLAGLYAATLAREALVKYDIAGHIVHIGTPDEEEACGKHDLYEAGIFEESQVWAMSHPTVANAIQPMSSRQNIVVRVIQDTHFEAVKTVYNMLVPLKGLTGKLPATSSTAALVEDVGMFVCNVVEANITLGVVGASVATVNNTINSIKAANPGYATTNFTLVEDTEIKGGVSILFTGNAGHAAENNLGALTLSIDAFQALNASNPDFQWYLPHNTTSAELDFTVDVRTRFTNDLSGVVNFVLGFIPTNNFTLDTIYPALEVDQFLGQMFVDTIALPEYGSQVWPISTTAPAATDASWVQLANMFPNNTVESFTKAVVHANFNICNATVCPFNHEPGFRLLADTDFAFSQTEKTARALAQMAVEILNDPDLMAEATKDIKAGPKQRN
ncbi:hypothetical protein F5884DRAFT_817781 [Xylogone sp. PMI_703]|nr:hypothetical protein F5884DRAFT_817781 [Xylogone sp. PMI_703]